MIEKINILHRFTGAVQFTAEIETTDDMAASVKLGLAVKVAVKAGANLAGANLAGAYLVDANLADADLTGANLAHTNLARADLAGANLAHTNLAHTNLVDANLADANLAGAYLAGAYLAGAYLVDANLADAKWRDGVYLTRAPIQLFGLYYPVTILDAHMQIGCECHPLADWDAFDNDRIAKMDGLRARKFWDAHKDTLLGLARADGRSFEKDTSHD